MKKINYYKIKKKYSWKKGGGIKGWRDKRVEGRGMGKRRGKGEGRGREKWRGGGKEEEYDMQISL